MEKIVIEGGKRLSGELRVHGSKNSALPILAAAVLTNKPCVIHNCPRLTDVDAAIRILTYLGCKVEREGNTVTIDATSIERSDIPRSSDAGDALFRGVPRPDFGADGQGKLVHTGRL